MKSKFNNKKTVIFNDKSIIDLSYRPFIKKCFFANKTLIDRLTENHISCFGEHFGNSNIIININCSSSKDFNLIATNTLTDLHYNGDTRCLPLYRYDKNGNRTDNITDWGLQQFVKQYNDTSITKQDIFHYVYAVLHYPAYRKKYELNLKREFPRIPFYDDFRQWVAWGERLMNLHVNYETTEPYQLQIKNYELREGVILKSKLKADKGAGVIILDEQTELLGIPAEAWNYKLGNRSALEWILDQYEEKKPKDPIIAEKFNTYRFADYKEQVIDLLQRVCTVSVETVKIVGEMEEKI